MTPRHCDDKVTDATLCIVRNAKCGESNEDDKPPDTGSLSHHVPASFLYFEDASSRGTYQKALVHWYCPRCQRSMLCNIVYRAGEYSVYKVVDVRVSIHTAPTMTAALAHENTWYYHDMPPPAANTWSTYATLDFQRRSPFPVAWAAYSPGGRGF